LFCEPQAVPHVCPVLLHASVTLVEEIVEPLLGDIKVGVDGDVAVHVGTHDHVVVLLVQVIMSFFAQLPCWQRAPHPSSFSQIQ
jgi:hypothetical protein